MTLYATHQLVKSETNGWWSTSHLSQWSHLAPDLLTAAPKIAIKLSPKTPGVLLALKVDLGDNSVIFSHKMRRFKPK